MQKLKQWGIVVLGIGSIILALGLLLWAVQRYEYKAVAVLVICELGLGLALGWRRLAARLNPQREAARRLADATALGGRLHLAWFREGEDTAELVFSAEISGYEGLEMLWLTDIRPREALGGVMLCLGCELIGVCVDQRNVWLNGRLEQANANEPGEFCFRIKEFCLKEGGKWFAA